MISDKLSQIPSFDEVDYLLLQLEIILNIVPMVPVKLAILVFVSLEGVGLDFSWPLTKLFVFDLHEHLGYRSILRRQYEVRSARWSAVTSVVSPPLGISI